MRTLDRRTQLLAILAAAVACLSGTAVAQSPSSVPATSAAPSPSAPMAIVGPVFPGTLAQAIPPLVNGAVVTVQGPVTVDATAEDAGVSPDLAAVLAAVDATQIEVAYGLNDELIIAAIRVPDADSAVMDAALVDALRADTSLAGLRVDAIAGRAVHAFDALGSTQYAWVNGDKLFWVLGPDGAAQQAVAAMPGSSVPLVPGGPAPITTIADLTIGSGPDTGTYHAVVDEGGCSKGALGPDQYGLQYSTTDPATVFSSLQLIINKGRAAEGRKGSTDLLMIATVNGHDLVIDPGSNDGKGTAWVTLPPSGEVKATYHVKGRTKDKTPIEATVTCASVLDFGG